MLSPNEFGKNVFLLRLYCSDEGEIFLRGIDDGTHVHVQELVAPTSIRNVDAIGVFSRFDTVGNYLLPLLSFP